MGFHPDWIDQADRDADDGENADESGSGDRRLSYE